MIQQPIYRFMRALNSNWHAYFQRFEAQSKLELFQAVVIPHHQFSALFIKRFENARIDFR